MRLTTAGAFPTYVTVLLPAVDDMIAAPIAQLVSLFYGSAFSIPHPHGAISPFFVAFSQSEVRP
jgi:hypothetical protein